MLLPPQGFAILYAFFAFASVGVIACALIAGQIVGPRLAPVAALTFAAYVSGVSHTGGVFAVDLPSVCIALVGVALFLLAIRTESAYALWGAVAVMIAAALMREILVYLPVFVAVSAALEPRGERLRRAVPWLVGLAVFALGYAAHSLSAWPYLAHGTRGFTYLHGGPAFVLDGLTRFSDRVAAGGPALVCFVLLGVVGAVASRRRVGDRFAAFATAAIVLPFLGMLLVGNQGVDTTGALTNYWGSLVVPLALALWPACALLLAPRAPVPRVGRSRSR
jgi:hypothetical protein